MNLGERIAILDRLGNYMLSDDDEWLSAKERASRNNGWFIPEFVDLSISHIAKAFLDKDHLQRWVATYKLPEINANPKNVGLIMAGNIPLVGFHDWLCVFISGHHAIIKASSKDDVLIEHLITKLISWESAVASTSSFAEMLKGCDAYIATGSNNSAGYFKHYFSRYPHIIRKNRTSVAVLDGTETIKELESLADDVFQYFGLGCRNVTKLYVPKDYDFVPLINAFRKYNYLADHHKFKNNYDYNLAIHLLNKKYYMSNESLLLIEDSSLFSPISQLNYEFYTDREKLPVLLHQNRELQCIVGKGFVPFGSAQVPALTDYADGVDTLEFLLRLQ